MREEASASRLRSDSEVVLISVVADDELDIQDLTHRRSVRGMPGRLSTVTFRCLVPSTLNVNGGAVRDHAWWRTTPYAIGIATGPSGLIVIDLDVRKPGEPVPQPVVAAGLIDQETVVVFLSPGADRAGPRSARCRHLQ
jgi:hypothetical protein